PLHFCRLFFFRPPPVDLVGDGLVQPDIEPPPDRRLHERGPLGVADHRAAQRSEATAECLCRVGKDAPPGHDAPLPASAVRSWRTAPAVRQANSAKIKAPAAITTLPITSVGGCIPRYKPQTPPKLG